MNRKTIADLLCMLAAMLLLAIILTPTQARATGKPETPATHQQTQGQQQAQHQGQQQAIDPRAATARSCLHLVGRRERHGHGLPGKGAVHAARHHHAEDGGALREHQCAACG